MPGIRLLLDAFKALRCAAPAPGSPCQSGLSPPPAGGPRARAPVECGRPLLTRLLPEKGGAAPVPHHRTSRRHGKKLGSAPDARPKERRLPGGGILGSRIFGAHLLEAMLLAWTSLPRADIGCGGRAPAAPRHLLARTPARLPCSLERAAAEREAS